MNHIEFYTDSEEIVKAADEEFKVVTVLPPSRGGQWDETKLAVYDPRSEEQMRKDLRWIYNTYEQKA